MIYLLRHGLDDENYIGGWSDNELIDEGKRQVHEIGEFIKKEELDISTIYSSDVKRASMTSKIICEYIDIPILYMSELRELNKGYLTGLNKAVATIKYSRYMNVNSIYIRYPNGESMFDLYKRIEELFYEFITNQENILIVTHRGVINMIYYLLNGMEVDMDKTKFNVTHASLHELNIKSKSIRRIK